MDFKRQREVIKEAIKSGCKTMAELALYLKLRLPQEGDTKSIDL